jgi:hypothetical protein
MDKPILKRIGYVLFVALVIAGMFFYLADKPVQQGVTNFDSITLSEDLIVGDDLTVTGDTDIAGMTPDSLTVSGAAILNGGLTMDSTAFTVADTSGNTSVAGTLNVTGNVSDSNSALTVVDNAMIDGAADAIQLTVQGYVTQTTGLLVLENSGGSDVVTVANTGNTDIAGTLQYGANNLYPVGFASSGQQAVYGTSTFTTTATATHGLTTVTFALCTLAEDPEVGAGDAALCSVAVSGNTVTLKLWQDDFSAATEASVVVNWLVIGAP